MMMMTMMMMMKAICYWPDNGEMRRVERASSLTVETWESDPCMPHSPRQI